MFFSAPKNDPWRARLGADGFEDDAIDDEQERNNDENNQLCWPHTVTFRDCDWITR
jgi:hypothetical protein